MRVHASKLMTETVSVDEKGRVVLPKKIREEAKIAVNAKLIARTKEVGTVELSDPEVLASKARKIGAKKLSGWKEEDHEATAFLVRSMKAKR
jgi:bifunctional DNA-binding transcriptional regulator/antitoxin component of YhaV-PrlF toxin-antitoxin module